jgi:hypothetical protein
MSGEDWRIATDADAYLTHQQKEVNLASRRPVPRKGSDLGLGPGLGANSVRVDDFSDLLATFNGYYSAPPGAGNAPNETESFVGYTISDAELGGRQVLTSLETGRDYTRTFVRSPIDPEALSWTPWRSTPLVKPSAQGYAENDTSVLTATAALLKPPTLVTLGDPGYFSVVDNTIRVHQPGVYTGSIQIGDRVGSTVVTLAAYRPNGDATTGLVQLSVQLAPTVHIPFTCWASDGEQGFYVTIQHAEAAPRDLWWRFSCTRVGEAA